MKARLPRAWQPFATVIMCKTPLCILEADAGCSGCCRFHWAERLILAASPAAVQELVHDAGTRNAEAP